MEWQIHHQREEGGGLRGGATGRLLDLPPGSSIPWTAGRGREGDGDEVAGWVRERGRVIGGWVRVGGVQWGKGG
jgi:hypothetical protein